MATAITGAPVLEVRAIARPSPLHGVTTVIMGNCGFALAPCRPEEREWFARCLTAVEDIPTEAMLAGIDWTWRTFPEFLDRVNRGQTNGDRKSVV